MLLTQSLHDLLEASPLIKPLVRFSKELQIIYAASKVLGKIISAQELSVIKGMHLTPKVLKSKLTEDTRPLLKKISKSVD